MPAPTSYRTLDPQQVIGTSEKLLARIAARFPGSGLASVAADLVRACRDTAGRAEQIGRPYLALRVLVFAVIAAGLCAQAYLVGSLRPTFHAGADVFGLAQGAEAALNLLLLSAGGAWFLLTAEERWKRSRIQHWLNELRAFAHVIDMHQLTKDPTAADGPRTAASPDRAMTRFELARYLDYCAEMLSLTGKLAAIYAGESGDHVAITAAGEVEELCSNLNRKIWQKIMILAEPQDA